MEKSGEKAMELRLLDKGRKGILSMIFSRMGLILLLLLLNVGLLLTVFFWFREFLPHLFGGKALFTLLYGYIFD